MLVDEVEPEESSGLALGRIPQPCQQVPRRCDRQKDDEARKQAQLEQVAQVSGEQKKDKDRAHGKHQADQAFGQDVQRHGGGDSPAQQARRLLLGVLF